MLCTAFAFSTMGAQTTTPFEFFENFDGVTDNQALVGIVPEGWVTTGSVPFYVRSAGYTGQQANSGDNCLLALSNTSSRDEVAYTPMMKLAGGKACTVKFWYVAPGGAAPRKVGMHVKAGTAQTAEAQTITVGSIERAVYATWTEFTYTFTPETDGEYCVSFWPHNDGTPLYSGGHLAIDDLEITGFSPAEEDPDPEIVLEPDPENEADAVEIPYFEDFEGDNYDGTTYVPRHWLATGTQPFVTAAIDNGPAQSGEYYLVTRYSQVVRDERVYTPFFVLEAGKEYVVSYKIYLPGQVWGSDNVARKTDVTFTVGCQQEADFHKPLEKITDYVNTAFEKREVKFTPEKAGAYCFSFALSSAEPYAGYVAIDDFSITTQGAVPAPKPKFAVSHIYDVQTSGVAAFTGQQIQLVNFSEFGESYEWSVDREEAVLSSTTAKNPTISFTAGGEFKVTLNVTNSRTTRSTNKTFTVAYFDKPTEFGLATNGYEDKMLSRGEIPTYGDGGEYDNDYVTGPNRYYYVFAERLALPADKELVINKVNLGKTNIHYKIINNSYISQHNVPFTLAFYGETDGKPDEQKEFGRLTSTMAKVFGTSGIGSGWGEMMDITLFEPITVEGPCYLAFIIDDSFDMVVEDGNIGASYMGLVGSKHTSGVSTLYVKPKAVPETSHATVGEWVPVDMIDSSLKGYGLWATVWGQTSDYSGVAFNASGEIVFDVLVNGDELIVSGTEKGDAIRVYNLSGALVAAATAGEVSSTVDIAALQPGVYVVKTSRGVKKFVK